MLIVQCYLLPIIIIFIDQGKTILYDALCNTSAMYNYILTNFLDYSKFYKVKWENGLLSFLYPTESES